MQKPFKEVFEKVNDAKRSCYEPGGSAVFEPAVVKGEDAAIKGMSLDVAPGPDGVILRTLTELKVSNSLATIATIMLDTSLTLSSLFEGRTVLLSRAAIQATSEIGGRLQCSVYYGESLNAPSIAN